MLPRKLSLSLLAWLVTLTALHLSLNVDWSAVVNDFRPEADRKLNVAYIPVT